MYFSKKLIHPLIKLTAYMNKQKYLYYENKTVLSQLQLNSQLVHFTLYYYFFADFFKFE